MSNSSNASGGVGFFGVMFLIFMTLKLCDVITWSWWWVTAPLWGPLLFALSIFFVVLIVWGLVGLVVVVGGWSIERIRDSRKSIR